MEKYEVLSDQESKELLKKYREEGSEEALTKLFCSNLKLSSFMAQKYKNVCHSMEESDLVQENNIALLRAIKHYDINKDSNLSTYIAASMTNVMRLAISAQDNHFKIHPRNFGKYLNYKKVLSEYPEKTPVTEEITEQLDIGKGTIEHFQNIDLLFCPKSTSTVIANNNNHQQILEDIIASPNNSLLSWEENIDETILLKGLYDLLNRKDYYIIYHTIINKCRTQEEIGKDLEMSKKAVNNAKKRALSKLTPDIVEEIQKRTIATYGLNIPNPGELVPIAPKLRLTLHFLKESIPVIPYTIIYTKICDSINDHFCYYQEKFGKDMNIAETVEKTEQLMQSIFTKDKVEQISAIWRNDQSIKQILSLNILPEEIELKKGNIRKLQKETEVYFNAFNEEIPKVEKGPVKTKSR